MAARPRVLSAERSKKKSHAGPGEATNTLLPVPRPELDRDRAAIHHGGRTTGSDLIKVSGVRKQVGAISIKKFFVPRDKRKKPSFNDESPGIP